MRPTRVLETAIYGDDLDAMRAFYEGVIGLDVHSELPGKFVFFRMAEQMLLVFNPGHSATQDIKDGPPRHGAAGAGHLCFRAPDGGLDKWAAEKRPLATEPTVHPPATLTLNEQRFLAAETITLIDLPLDEAARLLIG